MALDTSTTKLDELTMSEPHKVSVCLIVFLLVRLRNHRPMPFWADMLWFFVLHSENEQKKGKKT